MNNKEQERKNNPHKYYHDVQSRHRLRPLVPQGFPVLTCVLMRVIYERGWHQKRKRSINVLFDDTGDKTSGNCSSTLTDVESLTGFGSDGVQSGADHFDIVTWHGHLVLVLSGEAELSGLVCAIRQYKQLKAKKIQIKVTYQQCG